MADSTQDSTEQEWEDVESMIQDQMSATFPDHDPDLDDLDDLSTIDEYPQ